MNDPDRHEGREAFRRDALPGRVVPVVRETSADWWTPVAAFHRLAAAHPFVFLLESVEGGERVGRYSFLGRFPYLVARVRDGRLRLEGSEALRWGELPPDPLAALKKLFAERSPKGSPDRPPFLSGAVGYFGYDTVRWVEHLPEPGRPGPDTDDLTLLFLEEVVAFDHLHRRLHLAINVPVGEGGDPDAAYDAAVARLDALEAELLAPFTPPPVQGNAEGGPGPHPAVSNLSRNTFLEKVERAKTAIEAGDIFQVVLSQRFEVASGVDDLSLYRSLRAINPSPYMFLLRLDGWSAVGSSPEPLLRITGDRMSYRPIAGTAPRSGDADEDARRADSLRNDPKERAEHVMLVDLGRNDLGRSAVPGTVTVDELMEVEFYSHVMHLVSGLSARLRPEIEPLDALLACFPAGTVSGAPKVRAMQIIDALEPERRGIYGGAVGYLDFSGNLDTCIALRTMVVKDGRVHVQAGAGIVADSDPGREYEETRQKARALLEAVAKAEGRGGGMRGPWVKVCGLTREEDVRAAVAAGVHAIGLVLVPESPRYVDPARATRLARAVPSHIALVGVTVSVLPEEAQGLVRSVGLTAIQAHGEETPDTCRAYGVPVVKAFGAGAGFDLSRLEPYREWPVLLDGHGRGARGGTGRTADWDAARRAREAGWRVLLAGGLGPENLAEAVRRVQPVAVDLNSAVEMAPGIKDAARIRVALERLADFDPPAEETWPW